MNEATEELQSMSSIPDRGQDSFGRLRVLAASGAHRTVNEADRQSPEPTVEAQNAWSFTSMPLIRLHGVMHPPKLAAGLSLLVTKWCCHIWKRKLIRTFTHVS